MANLSIEPLHVGTCHNVDKSFFTYLVDPGTKIDAAMVMFLIRGAKENILVDTGASDPRWAEQYHYPMDQPAEQEPITALARAGLKPEDITTVINTHLHWDHCYNNHLFPNARIVVQEEELRFAIAPLPTHALFYESYQLRLTPPWMKAYRQFEVINGDRELLPGIFLARLPGHTPGLQGVFVKTDRGVCGLVSDFCPLFENWDSKPSLKHLKHIPPGYHVDMQDVFRSFEKVESLADFILPSHDPRIMEQKVYP